MAVDSVGVKNDKNERECGTPSPPVAFAPADQFPDVGPWALLFTRFSSPPSAAIAGVKEKISRINPEIKMEFHVFQTDIENGLSRERLMAVLSGFFGALAALLAMIGLYGVISYIVATRKNEIGIRMALGADRRDVIGILLR